jgi:hypothetical protein
MRSYSLAPFATPFLLAILQCGAGPESPEGDTTSTSTSTPTSTSTSTSTSTPTSTSTSTSTSNEENDVVRIPWRGGMLVALRDPSEYVVPAFRAEGTYDPAPDFSGLAWKQTPDYHTYGAPQYAALTSGEVLVFDGGRRSEDEWAWGVFRAAPGEAARFEKLPVPSSYGAFFPTALVANATDDVWVGAAIKREPFEDDFPGCPISVWSSLDDVYVAHWDGRAWTQLWTPHRIGRLRTLTEKDGALVLETGWGPDRPDYLADSPEDATWERSAKGAWTRLSF